MTQVYEHTKFITKERVYSLFVARMNRNSLECWKNNQSSCDAVDNVPRPRSQDTCYPIYRSENRQTRILVPSVKMITLDNLIT